MIVCLKYDVLMSVTVG